MKGTELLIHKAVCAPSSHNTQPWIFQVSESAINLYADRTRALPVNDPDDRELTISCGCALMNLRVAAAAEGLNVRIEALSAPDEPDLLVRCSFSRRPEAPVPEASLASFIEQRRTYRRRFLPHKVATEALNLLIDSAEREGAWLRPLTSDSARHRAAELVAEGDAAQWANPSWRRELAVWMHPRHRGDGLTVPTLAAPVARVVVRTFDMGSGVGAKDRELAEESPLLAVLGTDGDQPRDWLLAGQALERVLLIACQNGLQASYLNQPIQVASLRPQLQELVGAGFPQILLRLGYPSEEIPASPRRALEDVIFQRAPFNTRGL